jgi:phosphatidylserine decarboxylase
MGIDRRALPGSVGFLAVTVLLWIFCRPLAYAGAALFAGHLLFFRMPASQKNEKGLLSPASGTVADITEVQENEYLGQRAYKIGIFLSVLNAHVNYAPMDGKITWMNYMPGKFFNAMKPVAARENESNWIGIENGGRRIIVRQISGAIARRICCDVALNQELTQGQKLGIICYGSRTELYVPKTAFRPNVTVGQKVMVGNTLLGEWL